MLRLSVLDQSPVRSTATPADAIRETLALAQATDRLGFHRYWLAEHHSTPALAGPAPEVLIPQVAAVTTGIRVGSGGVMLQHYSALKVAESFRVLETLHPGRIDLGHRPGAGQRPAHRPRAGGTRRAAASTTSRRRSPTCSATCTATCRPSIRTGA